MRYSHRDPFEVAEMEREIRDLLEENIQLKTEVERLRRELIKIANGRNDR